MNINQSYLLKIPSQQLKYQEYKVDYRFKIIYSIGIICVIASHLQGKASIELNIQDWFPYRSFHMPLFMFSAGYFYKEKNVMQVCKYINGKYKKLILPINMYSFFYGLLISLMKQFRFVNNIRPFTLRNIFLEPLGLSKILFIRPSWFSSTLFFVEIYNILKRKAFRMIQIEFNEFIYFIIDFFISNISVNLSNKGYNNKNLYRYILRFMHLNIYYQLGILFNKHIEIIFKKIKTDFLFICIFTTKLIFHLYYLKMPVFQYSRSEYYNFPHFTVFINSFSGIIFYLRISELIEPLIGKNFYINIIADNTFSIMVNHNLANFIIKNIFAIIIYLISNLLFPIIIQKMINKSKIIIYRFKTYLLYIFNF